MLIFSRRLKKCLRSPAATALAHLRKDGESGRRKGPQKKTSSAIAIFVGGHGVHWADGNCARVIDQHVDVAEFLTNVGYGF